MTWIFKHIIASPFILFFVFYLLSLSNNLSITHDSILYLSQASTSKIEMSCEACSFVFHPNHLIYQPALVGVLSLFSLLGLGWDNHLIIEIASAFAGGLALQAAYMIMTKRLLLGSQMTWAVLGACGFSFGIWYYSVAIEIYILPLSLLAWSMYLLMDPQASRKTVIVASLLHSIAILFHQSAILFAFVPVFALISLRSRDLADKVRLLVLYILIGAIVVSSAYVLSAMHYGKVETIADFFGWIVGYGSQSKYLSPMTPLALVYAAVGFARAIIGGHFIFGFPQLQDQLASWFSGKSLDDEIFLTQKMTPELLGLLSVVALVAVITILAMVFVALRNFFLQSYLSPKRPIHLLIAWFLPYTLFFIAWDASNVDFWVVQVFVFWILLAALLVGANANKVRLQRLFLVAAVTLFIVNGFGSIFPANDKTLDYYPSETSSINKHMTRNDFLYLGHSWPLARHVEYFTDVPYTTINELYEVTRLEELASSMQRRLNRGQRVFLTSDVLDIESFSEGYYEQAYVDYLARLRDRFCGLRRIESRVGMELIEVHCIK